MKYSTRGRNVIKDGFSTIVCSNEEVAKEVCANMNKLTWTLFRVEHPVVEFMAIARSLEDLKALYGNEVTYVEMTEEDVREFHDGEESMLYAIQLVLPK
jgi:hypothetical protein